MEHGPQAQGLTTLRPARPVSLVPGEGIDVHPGNFRLDEVLQEQGGGDATTE